MKKDALLFLIIAFASVIVFRQSFSNFFTQDDFILIPEFSQNNLMRDVVNAFAAPRVAHWRPLHNLYYLTGGNIFKNNYFSYHMMMYLIHLLTAFFVYKIVLKVTRNFRSSAAASFIYAVHPAHFVSLFWISGGVTMSGLFFLLLSLNFYFSRKILISLFLFICALLASESTIVGLFIFLLYELLLKQKKSGKKFIIILMAISMLFLIIRFLFLTPSTTYDVYKIELSSKIFNSFRFYLLRIFGFSESGGDFLVSLALLCWFVVIGALFLRNTRREKNANIFLFFLSIVFLGFFPFILIPSLLSAHYMALSVFGFASIMGIILSRFKLPLMLTIVSVFFLISIINVNIISNNSWVVKRAHIAKKHIQSIASSNIAEGSTIVFNDNYISTSYDAYISLGTGKAIDFWFKDKNYKYCFSAFENCQ